MNNSENYFLDGIKLFNEEFYWDAIESFENSIKSGLNVKLLDDCYLNIGISYMKLSLFNEAKEYFLKVIEMSLDGDDTIDDNPILSGKTSSRAKLGLIRIDLANNEFDDAEKKLNELKDDQSHMIVNGEKIKFFDLAKSEIELHIKQGGIYE